MSYSSYEPGSYQQAYLYEPKPEPEPEPAQPNSGAVPGLYAGAIQVSYDQNRNTIPGLAFAAQKGTGTWQQQPQHPPNLISATQYYQNNASDSNTQTQNSGLANFAMARSQDGTAEEGEISEGGDDDFYEPAEPTGMDMEVQDEEDAYEPTHTAWHVQAPSNPNQEPQPDRERSRSYSPYLSPQEVQPVANPESAAEGPNHDTIVDPAMALSEAKTKARAAILELWPLDVRYANYIEEGIDAQVVKTLFDDLGLSTAAAPQASQIPGIGVPPHGQASATGSSQRPSTEIQTNPPAAPTAPTAPTVPTAPTAATETSAKNKSEERKDRIARLLAAKAAKAGNPAPAVASSQTDLTQDGSELPSKSLSEKQIKLKQKMEALQKSREARAKKAASQNGTTDVAAQAPTEQPSQDAVETSKPALSEEPRNGDNDVAAPSDAHPSDSAPPPIPGLSMTPIPTKPTGLPRKRPVAADFVETSSSSTSFKRPFGQNRKEKLVINVSDESEDEDVEMDIGSGDESTQLSQNGTRSQGRTSFRENGPLSETPAARQQPSRTAKHATPPKANLANMDKRIEEMKRQIQLAEARKKLKKYMEDNRKGAAEPKSNGQTPEAGPETETETPKPALRRVQSMGPPSTIEAAPGRSSPTGSPAPAEQAPLKVPKRSEMPLAKRDRVRTISESLPSLDGKLHAKRTKLRLLESQVSRLQREIEREAAEKQDMEDELSNLQQEGASTTQLLPDDHQDSNAADFGEGDAESHPASAEALSSRDAATPGVVEPSLGQQFETPEIRDDLENTDPVNGEILGASPSQPSTVVEPVATEHDAHSASDVHATVQEDASGVARQQLQHEDGGLARIADSASTTNVPNGDSTVESPENSRSSSEGEQAETIQRGDEKVADVEMRDNELPEQGGASPGFASEEDVVPLENDDDNPQQPSLSVPAQISTGVNDSHPDEGINNNAREVYPTDHPSQGAPNLTRKQVQKAPIGDARDGASKVNAFSTYESPFEYFRDYRYHPEYATKVQGGLRSLTYSNKIDPKLPVCPDELDGRECPKGADCEFQHFESMKLPDDQILLQLGGTKLEDPERAQFNSGLRELLQSLRKQNIKDFPRIAQGIVDYHRRFGGDPTRVLSLGNVSL